MALKEYRYKGGTYQFAEDEVPEGAVLVTDAQARQKQAPAPRNKARAADSK